MLEANSILPENTRTLNVTNVGLMLVQRLRRWPDVEPILFQRRVFALSGA